MVNEIKTIGVLTSGGDAPGMNAALRAVVRTGLHYGKKVIGIYNGYKGLLENDMKELTYRDVSGIINRGGTVLKTARCKEFLTPAGVQKAADNARAAGIDALVVLGGDGSFRGALALSQHGFPVVGIPCTIDNDIGCSDYTIGFDTALNTACDAIDKIRDTCSSHDRCSVVEVMGRNAGYLAINVAVATGAEVCLLPEKKFDLTDIMDKIKETTEKGKTHFIVVVAEGIGGIEFIAKTIEKQTGIATRPSNLGYIQRGGSPTVKDRVVASKMGLKAVSLLLEGKTNRVVIYKDTNIVDLDIVEALSLQKDFDNELVDVAEILTY
ncbi:MAG: 6-phosphofructokinase [Clostridia bacterium]|nr:6-phosphofructokinase [Clostridia bacterium]